MNSLNDDLTGKHVVIGAEYLTDECAEAARRVFRVIGGFGAKPFTNGRALFGVFVAYDESVRMEGWMVERLATSQEVAEAEALRHG